MSIWSSQPEYETPMPNQWQTPMPSGPQGAPQGATTPPPTEPPQINPFNGQPLPEGFPEQPRQEDFTYTDNMGNQQLDQEGFYSATESWYTWAADFAEHDEVGFGRDDAVGMAQVAAQREATHADSVIAAIDAEIEAGRLNLEQAEAVFNARMRAFESAGQQRSEMWKWTVPKGSAGKPLHADIREGLGMQPWISQPTTIDPFAEAQEIVASMPAMTPVSASQAQELVDLTGRFLG